MTTVQRIFKNTAVLMTARITNTILGFVFIMYVARYLGAEGFGLLSFALAFTAIFGVFIDIGLNILTIREVARDKSLTHKYLANIAAMKILMAMATFALVALTITLLGYPIQTVSVVFLIALTVIFDAFSMTFNSIFQAHERMEFVTIGGILSGLLRLLGALLAINQGLSLISFAYIYVVASMANLGYVSIVSTWKFAKPKMEMDFSFWRKSLKQAWPFGLVLVFCTIYYWIDSVMLSLMKGDEVVGWYNVAYRVILVLILIPNTYFDSVFPVMSRFFISSQESLKIVYEKSIKYMVILAVPIGVGTTLLAGQGIMLVFGTEYSNSVIALQILVWSAVFIFISGVFAQLFNSLNRQIIVAKVTGICALLNVVLNLILIPKYSYIGASIATVTTELIALALVFIWSVKIGYGISARNVINIIAKALIASAIMGFFIYYLRNQLVLWGLIPLSALLYFMTLYIIRAVDREDKLLFRRIIDRNRTDDFI